MRIISKKQNKIENKSVFLCKDVDYQNLGREVYADNVNTPFSFYLIRELKLARDYQNLAEGETYFEAICDSWDAIDDFDDLVVKKIYLYVETEVMYYSLYIGSFKPTRSDLRFRLKEWLASIKVEKSNQSLISNNSGVNLPEMQNVMKQLLETSNEIFRLRRIINDLNTTLENERMEKKLANAGGNPIISRSIQTIHLKRAQPLILDDHESNPEEYVESIYSELDEKTSGEMIVNHSEKLSNQNANEDSSEKKLQAGLTKTESIQGNITTEDRAYVFQKKELESNTEIEETGSDPVPEKLMFKKVIDRKTEDDFPSEDEKILDINQFVLKKKYDKTLFLQDNQYFLTLVKLQQRVQAPKKLDEQQLELKKIEDNIYLQFMNKRIRGSSKKNNNPKVKILRSELFNQITQAGYLHYSWGQVFRQRKEDVLICGRLSSANLVENLDSLLAELKDIGKKRILFSKKVRCSSDLIRRLEGYILMDQYMQKLSILPSKDSNNN